MKKTLLIAFLAVWAAPAFSQSGMRFEEFKKKLDPYFAEELISDIEKEMPDRNYSIWGWAVGDYSGDGYYDVAFSMRVYSDRGRIMRVYLFTDIDGFLVKIGEFQHRYIELPLEVGVIIRDNTCFVTKKNKLYHWDIIGYRFYNGALSLVDEFKTERIGRYTKESYINYQDMERRLHYFRTSNENTKYKVKYKALPCYNLFQTVYNGYGDTALAGEIDFVPAGAYDWMGKEDGSFYINSKYDDKNIYFDITVIDSIPAVEDCPSCLNDYFELWFDFNQYSETENRFLDESRGRMKINDAPEKGVFSARFNLGNFMDKKPFLESFGSIEPAAPFQNEALKDSRILVNLIDSVTYKLHIKIPFLAFGLEDPPVDPVKEREIGFAAVFDDVDNMFDEIEKSQISISHFNSQDPKTYGSLYFIPKGKWYGKSENIYKERILQELGNFGY